MKLKALIYLSVLPLAVCSCGIQSDVGDFDFVGFDPLVAPGTRRLANSVNGLAEPITVGSYVEVKTPNTSFYKSLKPVDASRPDVLPQGAPLQVIGMQSKYYHVRYIDNGHEGFVTQASVSNQPVISQDVPVITPTLAELEKMGAVDLSAPALGEENVPDAKRVDGVVHLEN